MCSFNYPVECCIEPRREKPCFVVPAKNKMKIICASMQAVQISFCDVVPMFFKALVTISSSTKAQRLVFKEENKEKRRKFSRKCHLLITLAKS